MREYERNVRVNGLMDCFMLMSHTLLESSKWHFPGQGTSPIES